MTGTQITRMREKDERFLERKTVIKNPEAVQKIQSESGYEKKNNKKKKTKKNL